jgi:hypothetical protein
MEGTFDDDVPIFAQPFFQQVYTESGQEKFIILTGPLQRIMIATRAAL